MKKIVKKFIVSSANWKIEVDGNDPKSAATSALMYLLSKLGGNLLLSTTIIVNKNYCNTDNVMNANFFSTHSILQEIGQYELSETLLMLTNSNN